MIKFENVDFSYPHQKVLKQLNLSIEKGSYTCIVGQNGSGKSTIAKLIIGLLEASSGNIYIDGELLTSESIMEIRKKMGMVFQNPDNQFIGATVSDDIAFTLENHCYPSEKMQQRIEQLALQVDMQDYLLKEPMQLSGGQKQRVAIASAIAYDCDLLILDEATSMLDPKGKTEILDLLKKLHHNKKMTVISITHDMEEVIKADRVVVLDKGKVALHVTPFELFYRHNLEQFALETPFVVEVVKKFQLQETLDIDKVVKQLCPSD